MTLWDKRKAGVIATLKKGRKRSAEVLAANTTLLPSAGICMEVLTQLRDEGLVAKIYVTKAIVEYELIQKFKMPAPVSVPDVMPQIQMR